MGGRVMQATQQKANQNNLLEKVFKVWCKNRYNKLYLKVCKKSNNITKFRRLKILDFDII